MNLRESKGGLFTKEQHLAYIGSRFRTILQMPQCITDVQVGIYLLRRYIFVHLSKEKKMLVCPMRMLVLIA